MGTLSPYFFLLLLLLLFFPCPFQWRSTGFHFISLDMSLFCTHSSVVPSQVLNSGLEMIFSRLFENVLVWCESSKHKLCVQNSGIQSQLCQLPDLGTWPVTQRLLGWLPHQQPWTTQVLPDRIVVKTKWVLDEKHWTHNNAVRLAMISIESLLSSFTAALEKSDDV